MRLFCVIAAIIHAVLTAMGEGIPLKGDLSVGSFSCSGYSYSGGAVARWELAGARAEVNEKLVDLEDVRLDILLMGNLPEQGDGAHGAGLVSALKENRAGAALLERMKDGGHERKCEIFSHKCRFFNTLRELKSDSYLRMRLNGLTASGIGYDIYLEKKVVHIRSKVMLTIPLDDEELKELQRKLEKEKKEVP